MDNVPAWVYNLSIDNVKIFKLDELKNPNDIDAIIIFHARDIKKVNLKAFTGLKLIKTITAGTDHIPDDIKKKYRVLGTHGPNAKYIAEHALSLSLACARRLLFHTNTMKKGEFHQQDTYHRTLFNSKVLIMGFGPIGRYTAGIFKRTFNANITIFKKTPEIHHMFKKIVGTVITNFEELLHILPSYDVVINTLPLTRQTHSLVSHRFLSKLKEDVIIINVSRGKVISEKDLFNFLKTHKHACCGNDVWYKYPKNNEPFKQDFPFEELDNIVMTPHNAPVVKGYFHNMLKASIYQVKRDLSRL